MIIRDSNGMILRTVTVDFNGAVSVDLQKFNDPRAGGWRGIVDYMLKWDCVLVLKNFGAN